MKLVIGFSTNNMIGSRLIEWGTNAPMAHCYIRVNDYIFHSTGYNGVHWTTVSHFEKYSDIVDEIPIEIDTNIFADFVKEHEGKPYSKINIIGFALVVIGKKIGIPIKKNPLQDSTRALFCSELIALLLGCNESESMSPKDIHDYLTNLRQQNPQE